MSGITRAEVEQLRTDNERLRTALQAITGFGYINLSGEYEAGLRDIIRSMTDCAREALSPTVDGAAT